MKHWDTEIKQRYFHLSLIFIAIFIISISLQLFDTNAWSKLVPSYVDKGQIWRLLTAHFIHINWQHFSMNMAGVMLCLIVFRDDVKVTHWVYSSIFLSLFSSLLLYLSYSPLQSYVGFSDVLHGWIVIGILAMLPKETKLASAMLILFLGKVFYENFYEPPSSELLAGSRVATESHLYGAIGGLIFSLTCNKSLRLFFKNTIKAG